ncbi:MAG: hypothetical protein JWM21_4470 [Acidobacteria bacterium]|nr:hypothetical protein [Acidobacteriota bacterium]
MNIKQASIFCMLVALVLVNGHSLRAQHPQSSAADLSTVTLLTQIKHPDALAATVNFAIGVRGDSTNPPTANYYDLRYGGRSENGDMDWFDVPMGESSRSQIRDLGVLGWSDIYFTPILLASNMPHDHGLREDYRAGKVIQRSPEAVLVKATSGHMYLLHSKHDKVDLYVLFRVEEMKPSDECRISWKVVPSPEVN